MDAPTPVLWLGIIVVAGLVSLVILWVLGRISPLISRGAASSPLPSGEASYLFDGDLMFDHDAGILPDGTDARLSWPDLRDWFAQRFAGLPESLSDLAQGETLLARPHDPEDSAHLSLTPSLNSTRVTLCDPPHASPAERHAMLTAKARMTDVTKAFETAPFPIWTTEPNGTILWRNAACSEAFDPAAPNMDETPLAPDDSRTSRFCVPSPDAQRPRWFEVTTIAHHWGALHHASDITKVVNAEKMQKDFVQTLTKTFAYLSIGLAVFDRNHKLVLFNPALVDLTSLGAEFLSAQPDLLAFFDNLRDRRVMPEPRSYAAWRTQIGEVIESAEDGLYQETWSLPNDVTYSVTGRPHPDGAIAFLIEDISAEVMLARNFRSQVELRQSALDSLSEAVMVIGPNHVLAFCNSAATKLLGIDPDICFADMTVSDLLRACAAALPAPALWREVAENLRARQQGASLCKTVEISPDLRMIYRVEILPGGAKMLALNSQSVMTKSAKQLASG